MHILIIPDGNRRWARQRGLPEFMGHKKGSERFSEISERFFEKEHVEFLTFWVLSKDNILKRSKNEIAFLSEILTEKLQAELVSEKYKRLEIRFRALGEWRILFQNNQKLINLIDELQNQTSKFSRHNLTMLLAYDGFAEIIVGVEQMVKNGLQNINFETIHQNLWCKDLPVIDGVIRTGVKEDPHNSGGVLMWLSGNAQYVFEKKFFPEFNSDLAVVALEDIKKRDRRLGK